jgi:hypothetical protein
MTEKFCTSCQCSREIEGGVFRRLRKTARWICKTCVEHKTESIYRNQSGQTADVGKIMQALYLKAARGQING